MSVASATPPTRSPRSRLAWLLAPSIWLSGRLTFSRKYLLIGVLVLLALAALSVPLWQQVRRDRQLADLERSGLRRFVDAAGQLSAVVRLREGSVRPGATLAAAALAAVDAGLAPLARAARPGEAGDALLQRWRQVRELPADAPAQQRFAACNGAIQGLLAWIRADAQAHRLHVDPQLDATFAMLTERLPQLIDTLGKQRAALRLDTGELTPYVLGAQVVLTESVPVLQRGLVQLAEAAPAAPGLQADLDRLLAGIAAQQDAADKTADGPAAWDELDRIAVANEALAQRFLAGVAQAADAQLATRSAALARSQWIIGALLVGTLAAISYLFAGIYASTLRSLRQMSEGTAAFCAGRLDARIRLDTHDELVTVARNFNTVAEEFGRLLEVIREQNESRERELETQVQARTAELAEKNEQLNLAARRVQEELEMARDMQRAILPQDFPDDPDWAVHASMLPARELGGDFYDVFRLPDGRCGVLVADVSGKGVAAAFFMAVSRTVLLDLAMTGLRPGEVLAQANEVLCQRNPLEMFVTACYAVYDPQDGRLVYASGGHPPPLLRDAAGRVEALPSIGDLTLAVMPGTAFADRHARVEPGGALLLYTDGVTEAFSAAGDAYGDARLHDWFARVDAVMPPARQVAALVDDVHAFVGDAQASDDLTCLMLCRKRGDATMISPPVEMHNKVLLLDHWMPSRLEAIAELAGQVEDALPDRPDLAFSANLCLEELITNIITHGLKGDTGRQIHVRMSISDEWLEIILKDDAPPFDPFVQAPPPDLGLDVDERPVGGLGVHLVKQLMDDARAYYDGSGNLIVLLKTLRRADPA